MTSIDGMVQRLSEGAHLVFVRRAKSTEKLKQGTDQGLRAWHVPGYSWRAELGVRLDETLIDLRGAYSRQETGTVHLVGNLTRIRRSVTCLRKNS